MSGFSLTARLLGKHFEKIGDHIAESVAAFDPETATEADHDALRKRLQDAAQKLAQARQAFDKEHADVVNLQKLIEGDSQVASKLAEKLQAGEVTEAAVQTFCDELEANKSRLGTEEAEEAQAKAYMDQVQQLVDALSKQLSEFEARAKQAMQQLAQAKAQKDLETLRQQQQAELNSLRGDISGSSTALSALTQAATKAKTQAEGMKVVSDIQQKPIDDAAAVQALRDSVSKPQGESTLDRLRRLGAAAS